MKKVDKLFMQVKMATTDYTKQVAVAFVDLMEDGRYRSRADMWDGKPGSMRDEDRIYGYHETEEEAKQAIRDLIEAHRPPGSRGSSDNVPILVCGFNIDDFAV